MSNTYFDNNVFNKGKAFIPFLTAGYPTLDATEKLILKMEEAGADLIEVGIPFSDPIAEGPVIQKSSQLALKNGVNVEKIFEMLKRIREKSSIPLVFMAYANSLFVYGLDKFFQKY